MDGSLCVLVWLQTLLNMTIPFTHSENYVDLDRRFHVLYPGEEEPRSRKRLPIPDLRFEQTYLHRIRDCLHIQPSPATVPSEDGDYVSATNVVPLLTSSQQVIKIDWKSIAYVTLRDQVLMPMLQGILWWVALPTKSTLR